MLQLALTVLNISCLLIKVHKCVFILLDVDMGDIVGYYLAKSQH